jgi:hypothetical protein
MLTSKPAEPSKPEPAKKTPEEIKTFHTQPRQWLSERLAKTKLSPEVQDDVKRVQELILSRDQMVEHLRPLDVAINAKRGDEGFKVHKAMTSHLAAAEQEAGFKPGMMPVDVLPGPVFGQLIKSGFAPPKDPGAGLAHGESTHRLQWHAIINAHKAGHLKTSPKDLYGHISRVQGLWGGLLDTQGSEGSVDDVTQGFRRPDDATAFLRSAGAKKLLPNVSEAVDTRYQKRARELGVAAAQGGSIADIEARAKANYIKKKTTDQPGSWIPWTYPKPASYQQVGHPMLLHRKGTPTTTADDLAAIEEAGKRAAKAAKAKESEASQK